MLRRIFKDRSGNFGLMTALMMVPMIGAAGLAVDFHQASMVKSMLQLTADSAVLGAVSETSAGSSQAALMASDGDVSQGIAEAETLFRKQIAAETGFTLVSLETKVVREGNEIKGVLSYRALVPTTLMRVLGQTGMEVYGQAKAVFQSHTYRNFYLLLDNTPSMGVAATPADVNKMVANTSDKCAFACHIVKNGVDDPTSYYNKAKSLGVTIRIDVVAQATAKLMDTAKANRKSSNQYRMAIYTFGQKAENLKLLEVSALTDDLADAKTKAAAIDLMSVPVQDYNNDQDTDFDRAFAEIGVKMGVNGTGLTVATPEKILFFVSDGVGDSYKPALCTKKLTGGRCQEPIDIRACTALKAKGFKIAVLYTTYLPLPTNDWYNGWISPFASEISTNMQACASTGLYFEVSPTQGISDAMNALFLKIVNAPRLSA